MNLMSILLFLQAGGANSSAHLLLIAGMVLIFYFFMLRPQMKKAREQQSFLEELAKGDRVVTIGGIHGRIAKINETTILLDVEGGNKLKIEKSVISMEFTNGLQANQNQKNKEKESVS